MSLLKVAGTTASSGTLYVDDVFRTYLYTGNGSTQTITNGIDLAGKGGLVWIKNRTVARSNTLQDTVRGVNKELLTDLTTGQTTETGSLTNFNSNGFSVGTRLSVNAGTIPIVSWTFRKAAKFFDVVTYTGTGSARTIAHNLGSVPGCIIVKTLSTSNQWSVYHRSLGASQAIMLQSTNAAYSDTIWNNTTPTSTVFSLNSQSDVNASGVTYVAYLFAHDTSSTGIIQCGNYTGNGSATGPVVTLGWEPQYLMIKNASGTGNWQVIDSMRGMPVGSADATLQPNLANAESSVEYLSPTATGFQITSTNTQVNTSGATYIYMAIRMPNKPPTTGTQVFSPITATTAESSGTTKTTNFAIDMQMVAFRDFAYQHFFTMDRLRGVNSLPTTYPSSAAGAIVTSSTAAEDVGTNRTLGFNNTGFNIPEAFELNNSIYWNFKRAPGFFDVVCYKGTGSATTQAHNLGAVPELMIVKERSAVNDWWVYVSSVGNTKYSVLNSTAIPVTSSTAWNNTTPTASVFSIGTGANVNASTQTFVAYLFATLAGISKVGSYTGNGTGQAIACGFSAGARFVLIKRTDSTGDWYTFDSARGLTSGSSPYLLLNSTAAEVTGNNGVYQSTGGFTLGSTASTTTNINGASYIYLSVA